MSWAMETMMEINRLTPDIKGKAFDPGWFLIRERLEDMEKRVDSALATIRNMQAQIGVEHNRTVEAERKNKNLMLQIQDLTNRREEL